MWVVHRGVPIVAIAGWLGAVEREADACSCAPELGASPADGATGVPVNAEILVEGYRASHEIQVIGPDGAVEIEVDVVQPDPNWSVWRARPVAALAPMTRYTVTRDEDPQTTFETSAQPDDEAPAAPVIASLDLANMLLGAAWDTCGRELSGVFLDAALPDDLASFELTVEHDGMTTTAIWMPRELETFGDWGSCDAGLVVVPGEDYCLTLRARDLAGNASAPATACATARACAPPGDYEDVWSAWQACQDNEPPRPEAPPREDAGGCRVSGRAGGVPLLALALLALVARGRAGARADR